MVSIENFSVKKNLKAAQADANSASADVPEVVTRFTTIEIVNVPICVDFFFFCVLEVEITSLDMLTNESNEKMTLFGLRNILFLCS